MKISNLRIEECDGWTRLVADISSDNKRVDKENTMWIAVQNENKEMLSTETYNCFLLLPLYMAMYYHEDLVIEGKVSKILYKNVVDYLEPILQSFSKMLTMQKVVVEGYNEVKPSEMRINGTGISCGVDCLQTVYKYYEIEQDPEYKLNGLFMLNCGWHGDYYKQKTLDLFMKRSEQNALAASQLKGIKTILVDSNLHAFLPHLDDQASYFCIYSCVFALEKVVRKYYISSSYSYTEMINYGTRSRGKDWSEYADAYALPLMCSSNCQIISDGCQFTRCEKMEYIADWNFSKKYLNVCSSNIDSHNCGVCAKCIRTLQEIEALGKLEEYSEVFDIEAYKKISMRQRCKLSVAHKDGGFTGQNYDFYIEKGHKMPSRLYAEFYLIPHRVGKIVRKLFNK